ncbi:MAG: hypothetical protein QOE08_1938, partial [Thermoleophilaceae bacterium]|nr:hypothetical protein [Thermoleophilaceae bacterium]
GPQNRIQPSGRLLTPAGKVTKIGNHPGGGALTTNGRFLWTLSAGRGRNDIRIVEIAPNLRCKAGKRGAACRRTLARRTGRVIQKLQMPGLSGGIAMAADGRTAYVSGIPESDHKDQQSPTGTPGKQGDVVHVFHYNPTTGTATRAGLLPVPPPSGVPSPQVVPGESQIPGTAQVPQSFPPTETEPLSWPRDVAVSRDGKTLIAALNLADRAAIVDTSSKQVKYVATGSYPYGAGITRDGKGLISNEADGTVSVIDLASAKKVKDIQVGPHLSHPEGIAIDPKADRAYVAVAHQDLIAVIDTKKLEVDRTLSVERPQGIGAEPTALSVTADGCRLMSSDSGEDAVAVFALKPGCDTIRPKPKRASAGGGRRGVTRRGSGPRFTGKTLAPEPTLRRKAVAFSLLGKIPTGSYPVAAGASPHRAKLAWVSAKGLGVGPNPTGPNPLDTRNTDNTINAFTYLPSIVTGASGVLAFPTDKELRAFTPKASRQLVPTNKQSRPPGHPIVGPGPEQKIKHVFYVVRENRTYDQIFGDDTRGDSDPKLSLFPDKITPNAHALARRFGLLDHVYANSEASIDGHFWTSAGAVSDYVTKNWHQNYGGRKRPYDFGVFSVTWPAKRFLFDQAEKDGVSYFNYGEAVAGTVPLADKDRNAEETQQVLAKFAKSDLGPGGPPAPGACYPNDAFIGKNAISMQEAWDSTPPAGAPPGSQSRFDCFKQRFTLQLATNSVPAFNYLVLPSDHTEGTSPGRRTPTAMIAENDYALGQIVDAVSHSPIWDSSMILVVEDDSQDGADHVDAHRIPALAISPYSKQGAIVHRRYDFLSFIRTMEIVTGMHSLNLFDAMATPLYDAFGNDPSNGAAYDAIKPNIDINERNGAAAANAKLSKSLNLSKPDQVPQRVLDRILWQSVHGTSSEPPPPGPNAEGEAATDPDG